MHSTKLLNPLIFKDSKDISFADWLSQIKNKLCKNANHYPTESIKLAYIKGLIKSKAIKHISPQLRDNAIDLYTIV